jgi:hypothetical protein
MKRLVYYCHGEKHQKEKRNAQREIARTGNRDFKRGTKRKMAMIPCKIFVEKVKYGEE